MITGSVRANITVYAFYNTYMLLQGTCDCSLPTGTRVESLIPPPSPVQVGYTETDILWMRMAKVKYSKMKLHLF